MKNNLMKATALAFAVCMGAASLTSCGRTEIDASKYVTVDIDGIDTKGTASAHIDLDELVADNLEAFELSDSSNLLAFAQVEEKVDKYLTGKLDKESDITNGDTVTFKWDKKNAEKLEEKYKIKLKLDDKKIKVTDLKIAEEFDPFEHLTISYEGIAPNAKAVLSTKELPVSGMSFTCDTKDHLSNGDTITVKFGEADCEQKCFDQGYKPTATEKTYTVEGVSSYVQKLEDIPEDAMKKMDEHAQDVFKAHVAANWADSETFKDMELIGNYMLTPKDSSINTYTSNNVYFIYKITANNMPPKDADEAAKAATTEFTYYYYSGYKNIVILDDGTCSFDLNTLEKPEGSVVFGYKTGEVFSIGDYYYQGYEDLDSMFNNLVTANIDKYKYESTVKE
jgi:hypothetical protein